MQKDAFYFPHEQNAMNDAGVLALRTVHGAAGYAAYFMLLEILRGQPEYRLKLDKYFYGTLSRQMKIGRKKFEAIMGDCINEFSDSDGPLVSTDGEYIWSNRLLRVMKKLDESRAKRAAAGEKGMKSRWSKTDNKVITTDNSKVKESKVNEIKENESKEEESKEKEIKKEYEEEGGGSIGEAIVSDFFAEEALEPDNYFGANEETKSEADKLTNEIWKRFVPEGAPSDFDKRMVFCKVIGADKDENGEWRGYISKEKTDVLLYAFKAAAMANKTGNWNYIESVLRRAEDEGLKTLKEIEDRDFEKGKM